MKIGMIFYDMQEFGGLEEYGVSLAAGLQELGHETVVFSTGWVAADNQYARRLADLGVAIMQPPKWLSLPASHWPTKEKLTAALTALLSPISLLLALVLLLKRGQGWANAFTSARGWINGRVSRVVSPDYREPLGRLLLTLWRWRQHPDVLHLHGYTTNLLFVIEWAAAHGVPVVYEEHQTPDARFDWWQGFKQTINKADVVVAVSRKSAAALKEVCGVTRPIAVRNSLLPDPIKNGFPNGQPPADLIRLSTVARLAVAKGLPYLLEAIVLVQQKHPHARFRVHGDGDMRGELLATAARLGLDGKAIFVGAFTSRDELTHIMSETDIFVMSSILEGQPLGVIEAMAYGRPIVTTDVGGIPEVIDDGVNGLLVPPADPAALAEKISLLIDDPPRRDALGRAARESYLSQPYQPRQLAQKFLTIYADVCQGAIDPAQLPDGEIHFSAIH